MNSIDAIILGVLVFFTLIGLVKGLIKEVGSLLGFFVGIWVATHYYMSAMPYIRPLFTQWPLIQESLARVVSFLVVMYLTGFIFRLLVTLADKLFKIVAIFPLLKLANRLGGAGVGFLEGLLMISAVLYIFINIPLTENLSKSLHESFFAPKIEKISIILTPLLPKIDTFIPQQFKDVKMPSSEQMDQLKKLQEHTTN